MKSILFSVLAVSGLAIFASGCSGFKDVKATKQSIAGSEIFRLQTDYNGTVSFSSNAMVDKARKVCPIGYEILSQQAIKSAHFAEEDASCAAGNNCHYTLEWQIQCVEKPKEEASIFGKT